MDVIGQITLQLLANGQITMSVQGPIRESKISMLGMLEMGKTMVVQEQGGEQKQHRPQLLVARGSLPNGK